MEKSGGREGKGLSTGLGGRDRAYRPEIVNSISVFRNVKWRNPRGIKAFLKIIGNGAQKAFEAFYELRDGFVRMMVLAGWVERRGAGGRGIGLVGVEQSFPVRAGS